MGWRQQQGKHYTTREVLQGSLIGRHVDHFQNKQLKGNLPLLCTKQGTNVQPTDLPERRSGEGRERLRGREVGEGVAEGFKHGWRFSLDAVLCSTQKTKKLKTGLKRVDLADFDHSSTDSDSTKGNFWGQEKTVTKRHQSVVGYLFTHVSNDQWTVWFFLNLP